MTASAFSHSLSQNQQYATPILIGSNGSIARVQLPDINGCNPEAVMIIDIDHLKLQVGKSLHENKQSPYKIIFISFYNHHYI
jgi:hypothetical protein